MQLRRCRALSQCQYADEHALLLVDFLRSFSSVLGNTGPNTTFWKVNSQPLPCDIPRSLDKTAQRRLQPSSFQDKSHLPTFHPHPSSYKDKIILFCLGSFVFKRLFYLKKKSYNINQKNITSTSAWSDDTTLSRTFVPFWPNLCTCYMH